MIIYGLWLLWLCVKNLEYSRETQETVLVGHTGCVIYAGIRSDNMYILSSSNDKTVKIWKHWERRLRARINGNEHSGVAATNWHDYKYIV